MYSFEYASAIGAALETDVRRTADGVLVLLHDATVDRTTASDAGAVASLMFDQVRALDAAQVYRPDLFSVQRIPTFEEYLRTYARTNLLLPEVKTGADDGTAVGLLVSKYGAQSNALVHSGNVDALLRVKQVDPTILTAITSVDRVTPLDAIAAGAWAVLVKYENVDELYVEAMHRYGIKVFAWTVNTLTVAERLIEYGIDAVITDDPALIMAVHRYTPPGVTVVSVPTSLVGSGWRAYATPPGWKPALESGVVDFAGSGSLSDGAYVHMFVPTVRLPTSSGTPRITTTVKLMKDATNGGGGLMGVRFCWSNDNDVSVSGTSETRGYYLAYRVGGGVEIVRAIDGVHVALAVGTWDAPALGAPIPLRIELSDSDITITRTDTSQSLTAHDATLPRSGYVGVFGSGVIPGVGETTVEY